MSEESRMVELLTEAVRWLRFQGLDKAKAAVTEHLDTDKKKRVYNLTDGKASSREIARLTVVGASTISEWWAEWYAAGILIKEGNTYRHLFNLSQIGVRATNGDESAKPKATTKTAK